MVVSKSSMGSPRPEPRGQRHVHDPICREGTMLMTKTLRLIGVGFLVASMSLTGCGPRAAIGDDASRPTAVAVEEATSIVGLPTTTPLADSPKLVEGVQDSILSGGYGGAAILPTSSPNWISDVETIAGSTLDTYFVTFQSVAATGQHLILTGATAASNVEDYQGERITQLSLSNGLVMVLSPGAHLDCSDAEATNEEPAASESGWSFIFGGIVHGLGIMPRVPCDSAGRLEAAQFVGGLLPCIVEPKIGIACGSPSTNADVDEIARLFEEIASVPGG